MPFPMKAMKPMMKGTKATKAMKAMKPNFMMKAMKKTKATKADLQQKLPAVFALQLLRGSGKKRPRWSAAIFSRQREGVRDVSGSA